MGENVAGWVWDENVRRFMRHLAYTVAYDFDDLDWSAIAAGLKDTDAEQGLWFDYPIVGERQLNARLAKEPDAHPVMVRVSGDLDDTIAARIETLIDVFSDADEAD